MRWHNSLVPMQCMDNVGSFPQGKQAAIVRCYPASFLSFSLCAVFLYFHTTGYEAYSFMTYGYGIFNMHTNLDACRTHEGELGTNKSAQELTQRDRKAPSCSSRRWNPGFFHLNSDALTTELRPTSSWLCYLLGFMNMNMCCMWMSQIQDYKTESKV